MIIESHRTQRCVAECLLRLPNLVEERSYVPTVINTKIMTVSSAPTVSTNCLCPLLQLVPKYAITLYYTLYERASAENFIRDLLTKRLPRSDRTQLMEDLLNTLCIIYSCDNCTPVIDVGEMLPIINYIVNDVSDE